jgi:hypothetical protein
LKTLLLIATLLLEQAAPPPAAGSIAGHVSYADGSPYARHLITAESADSGKTADKPSSKFAFTDPSGEFRFSGLVPGRYSIRAGESAPADAVIVTVGAGPATQAVNIVLPAAMTGFRVSGHVTIFPGQPDPPIEVQGSSGSEFVEGPIASDGTFELTHVLEGTYSFELSGSEEIPPVRILVDREIRGLEFTLPKPVEVLGTVSVQGRDNPAGLVMFSGPRLATAPIQPNGSFRATLIEGEYRLVTDRLPASYYIESITSGDHDLLKSPLQIVTTDKPVQIAVRLAASSGVTVGGHVTGLAGEKQPARISLNGIVSNVSLDAGVNADGSFSISKVMPGVYAARVTMGSSVSSPPLAVVIPNKDVADISIACPPPIEVSGRVTVDGGGPPPKFTLYLARGTASTWNSSPGDAAFNSLKRSAAAGGLQLIQIDVKALSDGSFKFRIPAGSYRVATPRSGLPPSYFLRSITYAGANLMADELIVSEKESSELQLGFGTTDPNPWVKVSGHVVGFDAGMGPFRVALEGDETSAIETTVNPDGNFEFVRVLKNATYTAMVLPENKVASTPRVSAAAKDVANVEIVVPKEREVSGRVAVDGGGHTPNFILELRAPSSVVSVLVKPDASGMFRIKLPDNERAVELDALPFGYTLKSLMYGDIDLRSCVRGTPPRCSYPPLKVAGDSVTELQIRFAIDPSVPFAKISGQVRGLNPDAGGVRLVLSDPASYNTFEESVGADGSFEFSNLPQGTYVPSLDGAVRSGLLRPSMIRVNGVTASGIDIDYSSDGTKNDSASADDTSTGARVTELGSSTRGEAEEASAVANLRTLTTAEVTYLATSLGKWGSMPELIAAGLIPPNFEGGPVSGFQFGLVHNADDFVVAAIPDATGHGTLGFYVTPDGVVRYSTIDALAPPSQSGLPVNH